MALASGASAKRLDPTTGYGFRVLDKPSSVDENLFRTAFHKYAQGRSDRMFSALAKVLGGASPQINFVQTGDELTPNHMSANTGGPLRGSLNMDPLAVDGLIEDYSQIHDGVVNQMPHEMAHTRQLAQVLADAMQREGGAQSFADIVTPVAAQLAGIPYKPGNYDGSAADYVRRVNAEKGRNWILGGQFGKPPVAWP